MLIDDDDKNLTRVMIRGAVLVNILVSAVGYDAGHQSAKKQIQPTIIHGNLTINNNSNNFSQPTHLDK
jgi:fructosamine-3-kinase